MTRNGNFDYRTASAEEIWDLASELPGLRLGDLPGAVFKAIDPKTGRGEAGRVIEAFFGIPQNSRAEADFPAAGIELKSVPLIQKSVGLRVDQRTVVAQINFDNLSKETWPNASVMLKLKILFVFFERLRGEPKSLWPIVHIASWSPDAFAKKQIEKDWSRVQGKVLSGRAQDLSESDGRLLGPCTKGVDGAELRTQPFSDIPAKPRAWALKPPFVLGIYEESRSSEPRFDLVIELLGLQHLMQGLTTKVGQTIDDLAVEVGRPPSKAKSYAASVVRDLVRLIEPRGADGSSAFPALRSPRVSLVGHPYEAVSFPAFRNLELVEEEWEDSLLLSQLEHLLFAPVIGERRETRQGACRLAPPVYWRASARQLAAIEAEWTMVRNQIRRGEARKLPLPSATEYIHVRPHGKDATDTDVLPDGTNQVKKSFWLNKALVAEILQSSPAYPVTDMS